MPGTQNGQGREKKTLEDQVPSREDLRPHWTASLHLQVGTGRGLCAKGAQEATLTATDWGPTCREGREAWFLDFSLLGAKLGEEQTVYLGK